MGLFNKNIIIGIHGLANKPEKNLLEKWWIKSIKEGFSTIGEKGTPFAFKLVYWADLMHDRPYDPNETDKKSATYMDDPYVPGDPTVYTSFTPSKIKRKILDRLEKKLDKMFFDEKSFINYDKFVGILIKRLFKDLDFYYHRECSVPRFRGQNARDAIRMRLAETLRKYRKKRILLIAHSMGTIISYDVLTRTVPDVSIDTLITIGSPLALPVIQKKILLEQGRDYKKERVVISPENIQRKWSNFSDLDDPVAINYALGDDYKKNSRGVGPVDTIVYNNYVFDGDRDAHKLYGYLRAPEVSAAIYEFLTTGPVGIIFSLKRFFGGIFGGN